MFTHLDDSFDDNIFSSKLTWLPAHLSTASVGERRRSDGQRVTMINWRATGRVEILAKFAADRWAPWETVMKTLDAATSLLRHRAAQLAAVTHAANNFTESYIDVKGNHATRNIRGSTDRQTRKSPLSMHTPFPPLPCCSIQA